MAAKRKTTSRKSTKTASRSKRPMKNDVMEMDAVTPMDSISSSTIDTSTVTPMNRKKKVAILLALVIIGVVLYLSRGLILAASVNGEFLYRPTVINELEKRFGKQELDSLITETLINQEAKNKNISISDDEINGEITKIETSVKAQGQDLDTVLTIQGMSRDELKKQVKTQKLVEKVLADKITPTDKEIEEYTTANKDSFPKDQKPEDIKASVVEKLKSDKLSTEFQTWLTEAKKNASIKYFVNY